MPCASTAKYVKIPSNTCAARNSKRMMRAGSTLAVTAVKCSEGYALIQTFGSVQDSLQLRAVDVATRHDRDDPFPLELSAQLHRCRQRRSAGALGQIVRCPKRQPDAAGQFFF